MLDAVSVSAVPELSTWGMMLIGFAGAPQHSEHRHEARHGNRTGDSDNNHVSPERTDQMMMHGDLRLVSTLFNESDFMVLLSAAQPPAQR